jgi:hypothetical protein
MTMPRRLKKPFYIIALLPMRAAVAAAIDARAVPARCRQFRRGAYITVPLIRALRQALASVDDRLPLPAEND